MAGVGVVAVVCAYLGVLVVLRREALASAVLVQVNPLGIALALCLSGWLTSDAFNPVRLSPLLLALMLTAVTATLLGLRPRERRPSCRTDGATVGLAVVALGVMVVLSWAIVAVASRVQARAEMLYLLFGNTIRISWSGVIGLAVLAVIVAIVHRLFGKEFLLVSFDSDMAVALGIRARWWNALWFLTIGATIAFTIRTVGAVTVFGLLVLPAATALLWGRRLKATFIVSAATGLVSGLSGVAISHLQHWPTGPTVVAVNALLLGLTAAARFNPFRGR
jgi:ABC-type Mn2+/Zn2+ transport system permease subunit